MIKTERNFSSRRSLGERKEFAASSNYHLNPSACLSAFLLPNHIDGRIFKSTARKRFPFFLTDQLKPDQNSIKRIKFHPQTQVTGFLLNIQCAVLKVRDCVHCIPSKSNTVYIVRDWIAGEVAAAGSCPPLISAPTPSSSTTVTSSSSSAYCTNFFYMIDPVRGNRCIVVSCLLKVNLLRTFLVLVASRLMKGTKKRPRRRKSGY